MKFNCNLDNTNDSNLFLRKLWSIIRREHGKSAWNFHPYRNKSKCIVTFGTLSTNDFQVDIDIKYKKRATIQSIIYSNISDKKYKPLLKKYSNEALKDFYTMQTFKFQLGFVSTVGCVSEYNGNNFSIFTTTKNENLIVFEVNGFDKIDAESKCQNLSTNIFNFISLFTAEPVYNIDIKGEVLKNVRHEELNNTIDEYEDLVEIKNGKIIIQNGAKEQLDKLIAGNIDIEFKQGLDHLHNGLKFYKIKNNFKLDSITKVGTDSNKCSIEFSKDIEIGLIESLDLNYDETIIVHFISALEVLSLFKASPPNSCKSCGQPKYKISKRVRDMVNEIIGDYASEVIKNLYNSRSKFLHVGSLLSTKSYRGTTIPQLSKNDYSDTKNQQSMVDLNMLREITIQCFRSKILQN